MSRAESELRFRMPDDFLTRIKAAADRECLPVNLYVRRFLALNIDIIDPPTDAT
jgi:predicted DNA binding CopG/RHH family protein